MSNTFIGIPVLGKNPPIVPVSNSEINQFKECRRKWWLGTYRGLALKNKSVTGALALGTRVHYALEMYYTSDLDPIEVYTNLLENDIQTLESEGKELSDLMEEGNLGLIMVEGYLEWLEETGADANLEVISAEEKLSTMMLDNRVELRGKMDLRVRDRIDNSRKVLDHKTTVNFSSFESVADLNEQLFTYMLLERLKPDETDYTDGAIYNMLRKVKRSAKSKPPYYKRWITRHNQEGLNSFYYRLHGTLIDMIRVRDALDAGTNPNIVAYPTPTKDCTWRCPFYQVCLLIDEDNEAAEEMLEDLYEVRDPNERYNDEKVTINE
jgi:hypothetical protein